MKKKKTPFLTRNKLLAIGIPAVLIPGILFAATLGWNPNKIVTPKDYTKNTSVFPGSGRVTSISDGDTILLEKGTEVRLLGINAPERGEPGFDEAKQALTDLIKGKQVFLEYDRYQDDKYGRILAWAWTGCEETPIFTAFDYMHLSNNESRKGLMENPAGCKKGLLINEYMVDNGAANVVLYKDRGALKYEERLMIQ